MTFEELKKKSPKTDIFENYIRLEDKLERKISLGFPFPCQALTQHTKHIAQRWLPRNRTSHAGFAFLHSSHHLTYFFTILVLCSHTPPFLSLSSLRAYSVFYRYCVKLHFEYIGNILNILSIIGEWIVKHQGCIQESTEKATTGI